MGAKVKCFFCNEIFDREKEPCVKVSARRYAHTACAQKQDSSVLKEEKDKDAFFEIVKEIYGENYNFMMINKQATSYIQQYNFTWSGMTGCLYWFYKIKHGSIEEGHGGIGIIPFIYQQCKEYYMGIAKAQAKNKNVAMRQQVYEFNIQSPRAWQRPPHLLNLEEEVDG